MFDQDLLTVYTSDHYLFAGLQALLALFFLFAVARDFLYRKMRRSGMVSAITRGDVSMAKFYGAYAVLTGVFVSLSLTVDLAAQHRTFFTVFDVLVIAYLCLLNAWFRNRLIGWVGKLSKEIHD